MYIYLLNTKMIVQSLVGGDLTVAFILLYFYIKYILNVHMSHVCFTVSRDVCESNHSESLKTLGAS